MQARLQRTCTDLLAAGRAADAAGALAQHHALTDQGLEDPALSCELIGALVPAVRAERALGVLPLLLPSREMFVAAVRAFGRKSSSRGVAAAMEAARGWGLLDGREARPLWLACLKEQGRMGLGDAARKTFQGMRAAGAWSIEDTPATNIFLHALHRDVKLTFIRCRQLLDEGLQPDTSTLNVLLKACMRAGDSRRADLALQWLAPYKVEYDEITFSSLIKAHSYGGQFEKVLGVQRLMDEAAFPPTPALWANLLVACGAAEEMEMAAILWWEMRQQLPPSAMTMDLVNAFMTACTDNHQGERAIAVLREAQALGLPLEARTYNIALKACEPPPGRALRKEELLGALALHREMEAAGVAPDAFTYGTLIELCAQAGQGRAALEMHAALRARGLQENVVLLTSLIKACGAAGMVDECMALFRRMVWGPARLRPNRACFRTLVQALRENGELGQALRVYEGMRRCGFAPSTSEFQELTAAAAEVALSREDASLQVQVASLCHVSSSRSVDLHGMSAQEARAAVLCVLALVARAYQERGSVAHDVTIITGRGEHSEGEPVLRRAIIRLLEEELRLRPLVLGDVCSLDGAPPDDGGANPGRVVIPRETLLANFRAKSLTRLLQPIGGGGDGGSSAGADGSLLDDGSADGSSASGT